MTFSGPGPALGIRARDSLIPFYYNVSDTYVAMFSRFIQCGEHLPFTVFKRRPSVNAVRRGSAGSRFES